MFINHLHCTALQINKLVYRPTQRIYETLILIKYCIELYCVEDFGRLPEKDWHHL